LFSMQRYPTAPTTASTLVISETDIIT
jgi:hypothetical protein